MGKDFKGRDLGKGISQKPDKKYIARYTDKYGERVSKTFDSLVEAKKWLADAEYNKDHTDLMHNEQNISVQAWYEYWIDFKKKTIKMTSVKTYENMWQKHYEPVIGKMLMKDVKVQHCQKVLNNLADKKRAKGFIKRAKTTFINFFNMAIDYGIIKENPLKKANHNMGRTTEKKVAMTISEQKLFLEKCKGSPYELIYHFILQTGLRIAEVIGLQWQDIDFTNKSLKVERQLKRENNVGWIYLEPKSETSRRTIYLTEEAIRILKKQKEFNNSLTIIPMEWSKLVFLSKQGKPTCSDTIDNNIKSICKREGLKKISCHILRHTFATRCIEANMIPKSLQGLLGHSDISITMNLYVDATEDFKKKEVEKVQEKLMVL